MHKTIQLKKRILSFWPALTLAVGLSLWAACSSTAVVDYPEGITESDFHPGVLWDVSPTWAVDHGHEGGTDWETTAFDADAAVHPCVLRLSATDYRMWYSGYDQVTYSTDDGKVLSRPRSRIGYATSSDGVEWKKEGVVFSVSDFDGSWDSEKVLSPWVVWNNSASEYRMWYTGMYASKSRIGLATSPDGISWTRSASNPVLKPNSSTEEERFDKSGVRHACVLENDDMTWTMYYEGVDSSVSRIGYATSTNGTDWWIPQDGGSEKGCLLDRGDSGDIASNDIGYPRVVNDRINAGRRLLYYTGYNGRYLHLGMALILKDAAVLPNGMETKVVRYRDEDTLKAAAIIELGSKDSWNDLAASMPSVISDDNGMTLWFTAWGTYGRMGYATGQE